MKLRGYLIVLIAVLIIFPYNFSDSAEYADIILNRKADSMRKAGVKDILFPHWFHRIRFTCRICHEDIFIMKAGSNDITMAMIMNEEKCGRCHNGEIAWAPLFCPRCHSQEPGWARGPIQNSKRISDK